MVYGSNMSEETSTNCTPRIKWAAGQGGTMGNDKKNKPNPEQCGIGDPTRFHSSQQPIPASLMRHTPHFSQMPSSLFDTASVPSSLHLGSEEWYGFSKQRNYDSIRDIGACNRVAGLSVLDRAIEILGQRNRYDYNYDADAASSIDIANDSPYKKRRCQ